MKVLVIAGTELRRLMRWRANVFFLFVLPMLIILLLGAAFGGADKARIGVLGGRDGPLARQFVAQLGARPSTELERYTSASDLRQAVARGDLDAGLVVPPGYDAQLRRGASVRLAFVARPDSLAQQLRATIQSVAADQGRTFAAAQILQRRSGIAFASARARAQAAAASTPRRSGSRECAVRSPAGGFR